MTTTARPVDAPKVEARAEAGRVVAFGTKDDLLGGYKFRFVDVEVPQLGKRFRVRELSQDESEHISKITIKQEAAEDIRKIKSTVDMEGWMARRLAYALVNQDMSPVFANPDEDWKTLNQRLPASVMRVLFDAFDSLSPTTKDARDDMGKDSVREPTA
jgi:hypothetical protein